LTLPSRSSAAVDTTPVGPATLERAGQAFRAQLAESFADRPAEIERRQAAYRTVLAAWQVAGARPEHAVRVVGWLEAAIEASLPGRTAPLPDTPAFDD
jgi:hypothetical protein